MQCTGEACLLMCANQAGSGEIHGRRPTSCAGELRKPAGARKTAELRQGKRPRLDTTQTLQSCNCKRESMAVMLMATSRRLSDRECVCLLGGVAC
jgi:hypothetical protein